MSKEVQIIDDPKEYGSKGQNWHANFVSYMVSIVTHPTFAGVPDAIKPDGKIQWEAPSNRNGGRFQHTHQLRRNWWGAKALEIGVDPSSDQWISTVAKRIHPTREKPCKRCGRIMRIDYAYPNGHLLKRLRQKFGADFESDPLESIVTLVERVDDQYGQGRLDDFRSLLTIKNLVPPEGLCDVDTWISWLEDDYIPQEPSLLSPGAMSNAPDRLDGFHSFNLCCRKKADSGRADANMRTYTTDRRVFEYWSDGNWIAADRMMGLISARFRNEATADGKDGPPSADHIGPLSLGFAHRPHFRLLSKSANSAKNNRMSMDDVTDLIDAEAKGAEVVSWFAKPLWDLRKSDSTTDELCLRLSKQLRDNQRAAIHVLFEIYKCGHLTFLASLLGLSHADYKVEFCGLHISNFVPVYDRIKYTPRKTKYASEQKARRLRIGFEALRVYGEKENRHSSIVPIVFTNKAEQYLHSALGYLKGSNNTFSEIDDALEAALSNVDGRLGEADLRAIVARIPQADDVKDFALARENLTETMAEVAKSISGMWTTDRYVRAQAEEND